jgi:hypothetical protein
LSSNIAIPEKPGLVPIVTYLGAGGLVVCVVAIGAVFFAIGAIKSRWSLTTWWPSGLGIFSIGMFTAALAFWVGFGLECCSIFRRDQRCLARNPRQTAVIIPQIEH